MFGRQRGFRDTRSLLPYENTAVETPFANPTLHSLYDGNGSQAYGVFIREDGLFFAKVHTASHHIQTFSLSTAFDLTTSTLLSTFYLDNTNPARNSYPVSITFSPDGKKMILAADPNRNVHYWELSTPWDIDSRSSLLHYTENLTYTHGMDFSEDGTVMFVGGGTSAIKRFDLTTPWDIRTRTNQTNHYTHSIYVDSFRFFQNGTKIAFGTRDNYSITFHRLSTPWDMNTITESNSFSSGGQALGLSCTKNGEYFMQGTIAEVKLFRFNPVWI